MRHAESSDLPQLDRIAREAKASWGYPEAQLDAWQKELETPAESLATCPTFVAEIDQDVAGFIRLDPTTEPWEIAALWVAPAYMRRGVGTALVTHVKALAARNGQTFLAVDSDPNAAPFYQALGGRIVAQVAAPIAGEPGRTRPQLVLPTRSG